MDLKLYGRVLWRFKFVVAGGILLAALLAVISVAKITPHGLRYRKAVAWQAHATLMLTQRGFPEGRSTFPPALPNKQYPYADVSRFASLVQLYAQFANSDAVRALMAREGAPADESISATPVVDPNTNGILPVLTVTGLAASASHAVDAVQRGRKAFLAYIVSQQRAAAIPDSDRVDIQTLQSVAGLSIVAPRKKTLPIVVFIAVLSAAIGLAFVLENLRPRIRRAPAFADTPSAAAEARRTA